MRYFVTWTFDERPGTPDRRIRLAMDEADARGMHAQEFDLPRRKCKACLASLMLNDAPQQSLFD